MRASAPLVSRRRRMTAFVAAELVLVMAVPFVLIHGYHTLLGSRSGTLIEQPGPADPGWRALVDPTELIGVAEVGDGAVTGVTLVVHNPQTGSTGGALLIPANLEVDGTPLSERSPGEAIGAVATTLRLGVNRMEVLDEAGWAALLGSSSYPLESPDPVTPANGGPGFSVGTVDVDAELASAFVGRPADGATTVSILPRRQLLWEALLAEPPNGPSELADDLAEIDPLSSAVFVLPTLRLEPTAQLDVEEAEALIRDLVAFPAGSVVGDRLRVRVVDRTGKADLASTAAALAAEGLEVIEIANAASFEPGDQIQLVVPAALVDSATGEPFPEVAELAELVNADEVLIDDAAADGAPTVALIVGSTVLSPG